MGRKRGGGAKYWGLLLVLGAVAFFAQMRWMNGAKRRSAEDMGGIAVKLNEYLTGQAGVGEKKSVPKAAGSGAGGILEVPCDACGGTGWRMDGDVGRREACPICLGHGMRLLRKLHADDHLCLACAGLGRVDDGQGGGMECPRCGGRGLEEDEQEEGEEAKSEE